MASKKRKRLVDDSDDNKDISTTFKRIRKDEYEESLRQPSSQSEKTGTPSPEAQAASQATLYTPTSTATSTHANQLFRSQASPPTSSAPVWSQKSITSIRERSILRMEVHLKQAYGRTLDLPEQLKAASPRLLVTCLGNLILKHLNSRNYSLDGIFRAISMQYENVDSHAVADAWKDAKQGRIHTIDNIPEAREQLDRTANDLWESWTTDPEALDLVDAEIEAIGLTQMRCVLIFAYKLACRLSAESLFNPNFTLLIYSMRHLNSVG